MEQWRPILAFPGYSVSDCGRVMNSDRDRMMTMLRNQSGNTHVGLTKNKIQHKRSVALLVANAFLPHTETSQPFDTPMHLDGDLSNNHVANLMWRPYWFAIRYHRQFRDGAVRRGYRVPIMEMHTKEVFENSFVAAQRFGLLDAELMLAIQNHSYVWPTYQNFVVVS